MKIVDSHVQMGANWAASKQQYTQESLEFWNQGQSVNTNENILIDISEEGKSLQQNAFVANTTELSNEYGNLLSDKDLEKITLIEQFIYVLTGKKIKLKVFNPKKLNQETSIQPGSVQTAIRSQGWGLRYDRHDFLREAESMSFSSSGTIKTADGRKVKFNLAFNVSREFIRNETLSIRASDAIVDPLVINFKNSSTALGDRNYSFDIDMDGTNDNIAFTSYGSGFLALDRNDNNIIDDGSELFGPKSGNGFYELAAYDEDNNGWIDENDSIYNKLRIWTIDETGNRELFALGKVGVGAIYLGNVKSEFGLKTQTNDNLGQIRSTGIFLKESGEAGTIQHVDLAI